MDKVILVGAGGHCKVVIDILRNDYEIVGLTDIDKTKHDKKFYGINVLGDDTLLKDLYKKGIKKALVTLGSVGDNLYREKLFNYVRHIGFDFINAISSRSIIADSVKLGIGNMIMEGTIINADTKIENNVIINTGTIIEHDCYIEKHVHISTGARLAGGVKVGEGSFIGIGSTVIQGVNIGKNVTIGAGTVIIQDIPDNVVVVGVPGKIIKYKGD
ncbi:acetyltransferase [Crassaminicella thermophila]|uniref:Acetyltransferase n=1 Tax=Crassaminicella thermophila TaxID=2599308 RepID=A0A5C0SCY5_CRATE|nr:acetyltransferase [Crassaminicella thermophila]QEK11318.1 acetyltransferase [Crassaminicella thermophila]